MTLAPHTRVRVTGRPLDPTAVWFGSIVRNVDRDLYEVRDEHGGAVLCTASQVEVVGDE